ncbi:MAG: aldehyde dehydrogenase (NADP(+)) [Deltaproteobacteria bacterium]|jgi:NADP-dependent aldehyde dehydrogenase|nr:aldehyde dehydrogenase (NADP(+)) [Deltaproteobacteria bacterium]MBW2520640.1 aldehyde dehydrogenase (NADP(+)) [Deltaproteobacteria bacterium]
MKLMGQQVVGVKTDKSGQQTFRAVDPASGKQIPPDFSAATFGAIELAVQGAENAFDHYRQISYQSRAAFLMRIGSQLESNGKHIVSRAQRETGLPKARLENELNRTVNQFRLFSSLVKTGSWLEIEIEQSHPLREPQPKPDLRRRMIGLGPVAVFGASNFPLAFSVPGGDTASALAAGCTVVAKGHPAHPGTSELAAQAILLAMAESNVPEGTFSLIQGPDYNIGRALVSHPSIKAVAFTGSHQGGRALFNLAMSREEPIPVYAEMGSTNPMFMLPKILENDYELLASRFVQSLTLGVGQFCTNPGLIVAIDSPALENFIATSIRFLDMQAEGIMLHSGIKQNYQCRLSRWRDLPSTHVLFDKKGETDACAVNPAFFQVSSKSWLENPLYKEEVFGPAGLVVACGSIEELFEVARQLPGQLTASLHGAEDDLSRFRDLVPILERKAGRILCNDFPTGVEVCSPMVHGGPYPASTDSRSTSVGPLAIRRFLRPVCYQNFHLDILPDDLR